jgi:hypothetical protein
VSALQAEGLTIGKTTVAPSLTVQSGNVAGVSYFCSWISYLRLRRESFPVLGLDGDGARFISRAM